MRRSQTPADGAMPEAKRDEVPLPDVTALVERLLKYTDIRVADPRESRSALGDLFRGEIADQLREYGRQCAQAALESTDAELEALRKDAARLDYLDARNAAKNAKNGTTYGWRLTENHNRIALEDHNWPAIDVRAAIDAALTQGGK